MLVLSRKRDEVVVIQVGETVVRVVLVENRGDKCRLGFAAESHVKIDREEVFESKRRDTELPVVSEPVAPLALYVKKAG